MTDPDSPDPSDRLEPTGIRQPPADAESDGIPYYADDSTTAYDEADRPRFNDSPAALPADEPLAVDDFGTTPSEARQGNSLDARLAQEEPDIGVDGLRGPADPYLADEATSEAAVEQAAFDADELDTGEKPMTDPHARISGYDVELSGDPLGRLVEPDEGAHTDVEGEAIGYDAGQAGGGLSAEELAMHEVTGDEVPYEE
jgi:hypothetical protein